MSNPGVESGRAILKALVPSEESIDNSIIENARLITSIIEARRNLGVSRDIGHDAFMKAAAVHTSLAAARDQILSCHRDLVAARDELGISPTSVGCNTYCVPPAPAQGNLRSVVSAVA